MENVKEKIFISDLNLATFLVTQKFELVGLERENEKRINFIFIGSKGMAEAINDFWCDAKIAVPIQTLFQNQRLLKNRLYSFKEL